MIYLDKGAQFAMINTHLPHNNRQENSYDLIVIGYGAAGLMAAAHAKGLKVLVLERMGQGGKKVLISGKGQCNFTHDLSSTEMSHFYGSKQNFVKHALGKWSPEMTRAWFKALGVDSLVMDNGKVFPKSLDAGELVITMVNKALDNGCDIRYKQRVVDIQRTDFEFKVEAYHDDTSSSYYSRFVLIATGGLTYGVTGSEGDGFRLAKALGHKLVETRPALTPIYHDDADLKALAGVSIRMAQIKHMREGKTLGQYRDDLLMTHKGLSGPVILNNSRQFKPKDQLAINFCSLSPEALNEQLIGLAKTNGRALVSSHIKAVCETRSIAETLIKRLAIDEKLSLSELSKSQRSQIVKMLTSYSVVIHHLGGPEIGMVTAGGVDTEEIVAKRMASKLVDGLYFAGEVCDVDGDTGGYNIQWAFSSAVAAINDMVTIMDKEQKR